MAIEIRQRIQFPFSAASAFTFTGPIIFNGDVVTFGIAPTGPTTIVTFSSVSQTLVSAGAIFVFDNNTTINGTFSFTSTSVIAGSPAVELSPQSGSFINFSGAGGITYASGTEEHFETGSELLMDAGSVAIFNNVPTFNDGLVLGPGESILSEYVTVSSFVPVPTGFTIVPGTGAVTFTMEYTIIGNRVMWNIIATITGTATIAGTQNVSYFALPFSITRFEANHMIDDMGNNYGHGVSSLAKAYGPTFSPVGLLTTGGFIAFSGEGFLS